ncbi:MAG: hypothetical protein PHQ64_02965 [Bacilli bacterium]|nr:hypothetical protein [Bacilli bacterium]
MNNYDKRIEIMKKVYNQKTTQDELELLDSISPTKVVEFSSEEKEKLKKEREMLMGLLEDDSYKFILNPSDLQTEEEKTTKNR